MRVLIPLVAVLLRLVAGTEKGEGQTITTGIGAGRITACQESQSERAPLNPYTRDIASRCLYGPRTAYQPRRANVTVVIPDSRVTPAQLTITANNQTKAYGAPNPPLPVVSTDLKTTTA